VEVDIACQKYKMISVKIYHTNPVIVAVADEEIIGKYFEEGEKQINIDGKFYRGEIYEEKDAKKILKKLAEDYCSFNIVGKRAVKIAIELGIVEKENVLYIKNIPIALVF
jgi:hypothetical protein